MICQYINEQQVVKVIWHKAALPQQTDGSIVNPMRAHYRHLANMTELVLPLAHQSPQLKRQIDWFSNFCTAYGRVSSGMPGHVLSPNNCPFACGIWTCFLRLTWVHNPNGILVSSAVFGQMTAECPYTLQWDAPSPFKIASSHGRIWIPSNMVPCVHPSPQPKWHLDQFSCFCRAHYCNRQTLLG